VLSTLKMLQFPESATNRLPAPSQAKPAGLLSSIGGTEPSRGPKLPFPSVLPSTPADPANVITTPVAMNSLRIVRLPP
jgi:hypothetical protein